MLRIRRPTKVAAVLAAASSGYVGYGVRVAAMFTVACGGHVGCGVWRPCWLWRLAIMLVVARGGHVGCARLRLWSLHRCHINNIYLYSLCGVLGPITLVVACNIKYLCHICKMLWRKRVFTKFIAPARYITAVRTLCHQYIYFLCFNYITAVRTLCHQYIYFLCFNSYNLLYFI